MDSVPVDEAVALLRGPIGSTVIYSLYAQLLIFLSVCVISYCSCYSNFVCLGTHAYINACLLYLRVRIVGNVQECAFVVWVSCLTGATKTI